MDDRNARFLTELQAICVRHGMLFADSELAEASRALDYDPPCILAALLSSITASHCMEQGEASKDVYTRLLSLYAAATRGEFVPYSVEADSEDGWETLVLQFVERGIARTMTVEGVEDSDYFTPDFVGALNNYAESVGLCGRWVDFYDGDDACASVYVPLPALSDFYQIKRKFSKN